MIRVPVPLGDDAYDVLVGAGVRHRLAEVLPEGAQLVETLLAEPPMTMVGHVTSSYHSPNLGRSIALALIKGGRDKMDQVVHAPLVGGKTVACRIANPVFFDPEGERLRG